METGSSVQQANRTAPAVQSADLTLNDGTCQTACLSQVSPPPLLKPSSILRQSFSPLKAREWPEDQALEVGASQEMTSADINRLLKSNGMSVADGNSGIHVRSVHQLSQEDEKGSGSKPKGQSVLERRMRRREEEEKEEDDEEVEEDDDDDDDDDDDEEEEEEEIETWHY
ncbi:hypothetical protein PoB_007644400 [Plakobranchus ocellatus]|uniref:Uncharacterized protein n=1 Tax=Plakobranchus ocellatus TaxID=259542 RepID=A0AAV4E0W2_9GAST|nr:hypothetical protein PoB_007644400 [Plakobranchus ocellatus]